MTMLPLANNPVAANAAQQAAASAPSASDTNIFGLTNQEMGVNVSVSPTNLGSPPAGPFGMVYQQPTYDPFGIGVPMETVGQGDITVQDLLNYIQSLTPNQISQVQADLANAGYYGAMNSLSQEPMWGSLGNVDFVALGRFAKDAISAVQGGTTISSMLQLRTQQYSTQMQQISSRTPIKDLGKNYTITNLDPNEALNMVDQSAMKVLGTQLPAEQRTQMGRWLNQLYTSRQQSADQGDIAQNAMNAEAQAQASDFIDPVTGRALDYNGVVATARSQMGVPYQWGGTTPGKGLDCSGLTQWVYGQNGIAIPRTSQEQWQQGTGQKFTDIGQAAPGDLVFFVGGDGTQSAPGHVGIYIGNGMMIDAPHTGSSVRLDNVQSFGGLVGFMHYGQIANTTLAATNMPPGTAPAGSAVAGSGASNEQAAMEFLMGHGISQAGAAGIVGNLMQESNVNPEEPGGGIAQWQGSRFSSNLQTGNPQVDLTNQLGLLVNELTSQYPDLLKSLQSATDPTAASQAFEAQYERAGIPDQAKRDSYAQSLMQKAQSGGWGSTPPTTGDPGSQVAASEGVDANGGRSIVSTPNTFTQAFDESQQALNDTLEAQIRASNPALASAHDYTNAYGMLTKVLRDGITVNNQ